MDDSTKAFLGGMLGGIVGVILLGGIVYVYVDYRIKQAIEPFSNLLERTNIGGQQ